MRKHLWLGVTLGVVSLIVMGGIVLIKILPGFVGGNKSAAHTGPIVIKQGNSGRYLYAITRAKDQSKLIAQFDPTLPTDDDIVVGALKAVVKDSFGLVIGPEVQPVVETLQEINYVTFTVSKHKFLFELFRNSSGQVGSAQFWEE